MRVRFADFVLDEPRFELSRGGVPLPVQPKVLDLLLYLVRHRERMVSKEELFREVWPGVLVTEAALGQAVTHARRAVGDSRAAQHTIRTIHGKGFRFVASVEEVPNANAAPAAVSAPVPSHLAPIAAPPSSHGSLPVSSTHRGATNPSLGFETKEEHERAAEVALVPQLFVVLHCDRPELGSSRHSLRELDEVLIVRGEKRRARRERIESTSRMTLALPGHAVSRDHARLVRIREGWFAVDSGAKNGTYVNGERIKRQRLQNGDLIECGRTFMLFEEHQTPEGVLPDADSADFTSGSHFSLLPSIQFKQHLLTRIARAELPVLLIGETGVGKSRAARTFHEASGRAGPFVSLDAGVLFPEKAIVQLLGDMVVGKTGGDLGFVRAAHGGTLFIEHVENLSPAAQACLLRVIDEGIVVPAGSSQEQRVDVRFIAASSAKLPELTAQGRFNSELLAQFSAFQLELPALRERRGDFGWMVASLMRETQNKLCLTSAAALALLRHGYPNNWLELRHCLTSAAALAQGKVIDLPHLRSLIGASRTPLGMDG